jgi:hypothetical protein
MHPFHEYLNGQLTQKLKQRRVVVWYDPRREFELYVDELPTVQDDGIPAPRARLGDTEAHLARFDGSYFGLRLRIEPLVSGPQPASLLLYIGGQSRDPINSVLMELEKAGATYEPRLKGLARNLLRQKFTDGQIDEMLRPEGLAYQDISRLMMQGEAGGGSVLKLVFPGRSDTTALLSAWLASDEHDAAIQQKGAAGELCQLSENRLGLTLNPTADLANARETLARYLLVNEFRSDLSGKAPASIGMVPVPQQSAQSQRIGELAARLRKEYPESYVALADRVEADLNLASSGVAAAELGALDTFRFEERILLHHCDELIAHRRYAEALSIIEKRSRSFWLDRDVLRLAQWRACQWMAELGAQVEAVRPALAKMGDDPAAWVQKYTADDGWHRADLLHRNLEAWVAGMDDQPEAEQALRVVRQDYDKLLRTMAEEFTRVLRAAHWSVPGVLHQTRIFPTVVEAGGGRTAYFLVDSMRFEMGVELKEQLREAEDLTLRPAVAALPTITPVGMAALLPGASSSFSVVEHKGKPAARIEDAYLPGWQERKKYLQAVRPDTVELTLDELLQTSLTKLQKRIENTSLVVVRSSEIDFLGESGNDLLARQFINTIIGNIARAVRLLAKAGIERFAISADHGHQYGAAKGTDMVTDNPGGDTVKVERRCWVGRGGQTPAGAVRVCGADLGYDTDLDLVFSVGLGVFQTYGGLSYHHGGVSLQELIVPVLSLRVPPLAAPTEAGERISLTDYPTAITNRVFSVKVKYGANLLNRNEPRSVRVVLIASGEQVGRAEMAIDADCDPATGTVALEPGRAAGVGLLLVRDDAAAVKVVVLDPSSDAVLAESPELPVKLGI